MFVGFIFKENHVTLVFTVSVVLEVLVMLGVDRGDRRHGALDVCCFRVSRDLVPMSPSDRCTVCSLLRQIHPVKCTPVLMNCLSRTY